MSATKIPLSQLLEDVRGARERGIVRNVRTYSVYGRCEIITFNTELMSVDTTLKLLTYLQTQCEDVEYAEAFSDEISIRYKI